MLCAYLNLLYAHSKYSWSNVSLSSYWLIQGDVNLIFFGALEISWRHQMLLYLHSSVGSCSMSFQNMAGADLFYHVGT
jgi:hypothetical protein